MNSSFLFLLPNSHSWSLKPLGVVSPTEQIGKLGAGPCSESHRSVVETVGRKAAGPLRSSRAFALCAQGRARCPAAVPVGSLCSAVTAGDKASYHASPHQAWEIRGKTPPPQPPTLHSFSRPILQGGKRALGPVTEPAASVPRCSAHGLPEHLQRKMKTPFSLPHPTGEGTEAQWADPGLEPSLWQLEGTRCCCTRLSFSAWRPRHGPCARALKTLLSVLLPPPRRPLPGPGTRSLYNSHECIKV